MRKRLQKRFFTAPTVHLAEALLGCLLVRETSCGRIAGVITETEAYTEDDAASHAFGGKRTERNAVMFADGGYAYVYFIYGMYHCLNVVAEKKGRGCAVLIRAILPVEGAALMRKNRRCNNERDLANGPGKICQALGITAEHNGIDMTDSQSPIYIIGRGKEPITVTCTPRIGISKARSKPWRFLSA